MVPLNNYIDNETMVVLNNLTDGHIPLGDKPLLESYARIRKEVFRLGVVRAYTYRDVDAFLKAYDPTLQLRFSIEFDCWVVDRWVENGHYWIMVMPWVDEDDQSALPIDIYAKYEMVAKLAANNMQRAGSPYEYYLQKRRAAKKRQAELKAQREEEQKAAWDGLSRRAQKDFQEVITAIETGEKIVSYGDDAKSLERMQQSESNSIRSS